MSKRARPGPNQDRWPPIPQAEGARRNALRRFGSWAWLLAMAMLGCSSPPTTVRLEVYSWWDERREQLAFELVRNLHQSLHPNVEVVNQARLVAGDARLRVAEITLAGAPPATFQANIGADLLRWTAVDSETGAPGKNRIYDLSSLFARSKLTSVLPRVLLDALSVGTPPLPYAVPINIHRLNVLYYNTAKLAAWSPPPGHQSWLELSVLCPTEPTATPLPFKIAVGTTQKFTLTLLVFENLLVAQAGAEFYERLFRGEMSTVSGVADEWKDVVRTTLRCAQFLGRSIQQTDSWKSAVRAVTDGNDDAAVTVMGDWAGGQLASDPNYGDTILAMPFPGTEANATKKGTYVYTSDAFPLPVHAEHLAEAETLLETMALPDAQRIFSEEKGSIPARSDVTGLSAVDAARRDDFRDSSKALATSGLFPPYYDSDDLNDKLQDMITKDLGSQAGSAAIEAVVEELVALQPLLLRWQDRLRQGPLDSPMP
jgi:glucose/mannose transport system substrate-binding protein